MNLHGLTNQLTRLRLVIALAAVAVMAAFMPQRMAAQTDIPIAQYYELPNYYNAAAIGNSDLLRIRGGARLQWLGIKKAPQGFLITGDMPFKFLGQRMGVGLIMQQESQGLYSNLTLGAQIAYKLKLLGGYFSVGAQIGFIEQSFKGTEVYIPDNDDYHQSTDDAIPTRDIKGNAFDVAAGVFYSHRYFWLGASCTHITSPNISLNSESGENSNEKNYEFQINRTLYFIAGSNIPIKNTLFEVIPSAIVRTDFQFFSWDFTARCRYNKFISAGLGYRWKDAVYINVTGEYKNFYLGYTYEYPTSAIARASSGSHEVFAGYSLKLTLSDKNRHRHKSIRIM